MAYINQEMKHLIADKIKRVLIDKFPDVRLKWTMAVRNRMSLVLTIREGNIDFVNEMTDETRNVAMERFAGACFEVNQYWYQNHFKDGIAKSVLTELIGCLNSGNWDNSDPMVDYFDVGWYITINVGKWDSPYIYRKE